MSASCHRVQSGVHFLPMSHQLLTAFLLDNPPLDLYSGEVRAYLRQDGPLLALATILIALGILSVAVCLLRNKSNERGFLWFGALAGAYGLRLVFSSDVFHFTATVDKTHRPKWSYPEWAVAYMLIPFAALFLSEVFPDWDRVLLKRLKGLLIVFAVIAIAADVILHRAGSLQMVFGPIVIIGLVAELTGIPRLADAPSRGWLRATGLAFLALVLVESLWRFRSASFPVKLQIIEAFFFACWLVALGAVLARRIIYQTRRI